MNHSHKQEGFTLLEVLVALAVLGTAIAVVMQLFAANLRTLYASKDYIAATAAGERKLKDMLAMREFQDKTWSETDADGFRFDVELSETMKEKTENKPIKLIQINLTVRWSRGMHERVINLKTFKAVNKTAGGEMSLDSIT
jgi:prepilin-type N-terminal cleavage/methylation domain-containing protein